VPPAGHQATAVMTDTAAAGRSARERTHRSKSAKSAKREMRNPRREKTMQERAFPDP